MSVCPNCEQVLKPEENFCHNCGQENHDLKIPLGHLIYEFIESIFHFDIKVWETLRVAFTRPGLLTKHFNEGKRARYVPPARLYIFISVIFFFLLNYVADKSLENSLNNWIYRSEESIINADFPSLQFANSELIDGSVRNGAYVGFEVDKRPENPRDTLLTRLDKYITSNVENSKKSIDETTLTYADNLSKNDYKSLLSDSIYVQKLDSSFRVRMYFSPEILRKDSLNGVKWLNSSNFIDNKLNGIDDLNNDFLRSLAKTLMTLNMSARYENISALNDRLSDITHKVLKYLSLSMFLLMPVVALLLKLLYFRKTYYYENFIFSIFHHGLAFIWFSILIGISQAYLSSYVVWGFFLSFFLYLLFAMKKHFGQGWLPTILKYFVLGLSYFFLTAIITGAILIAGLL